MKTGQSKQGWRFAEIESCRKVFAISDDVRAGTLTCHIGDGDEESFIVINQQHVRDLLPLLQHFAETGRLPEPESTTKGGE